MVGRTGLVLLLSLGIARAGDPPDLLLEAEATPEAPYVQGEVRYTVRVLRSSRLIQGKLLGPRLPDAVVEPLGPSRQGTTRRNGRRYHVTERQFAIFPQSSGRIALEGAVFSGPERFARAPAVALQVREPPDSFKGSWWLPARSVELTASWSRDPARLRVGEQAVRTLRLRVAGQAGERLPPLAVPESAGLRAYREGGRTETRKGEGGVVGIRQVRRAWVVTRPGRHTLPAVTVPWWDVRGERTRTARVPKRTIRGLPAPGQERAPGETPAPRAGSTVSGGERTGPGQAGYPSWTVLAGWALGLLFLAGIGRALARSRTGKRLGARWRLRAACRRGDPRRARRALLEWGRAAWPERPPGDLGELARRLGGEASGVADCLGELERIRFGRAADETWDGAACWRTLGPALQGVRGKHPKGPGPDLPPLYPPEPSGSADLRSRSGDG